MKTINRKTFNYQAANKGIDTLIFRVGCSAGFFSEMNNMILAMIYCLEKKIRFELYSRNAIHSEDGWLDFFEPFTEHHSDAYNERHNRRPNVIPVAKPQKPRSVFSLLLGKKKRVLRTQDLWEKMRIFLHRKRIKVRGFEGDLLGLGAAIIQSVWRYNDRTQAKIDAYLSSIAIPEEYLSMQIRRGDKYTEAPDTEIEAYFNKIEELQLNHLPIYLLTDDHLIIDEVRRKYPQKDIFYLPNKNDGFFLDRFNQLSNDSKYETIVKLLAEIEIMRKSKAFIGTWSSNVAMFLGMDRQGEMTFGVDYPHWRLL